METLMFKHVIISGHVTIPNDVTPPAKNGVSSTTEVSEEDSVEMETDAKVELGKPKPLRRSDTASSDWPGFLQGLTDKGVPFDVIRRGQKNALSRLISPDEVDLVQVADPERILGLERPVVVALGTSDVRATYPRYVDPWFDVIACCTSQLVVVEDVEPSLEVLLRDKLALNKPG